MGIRLGGSLNTYGYVGASPLGFVDSDGLNPLAGCAVGAWAGPVGCGVGAAIGLAINFLGIYAISQAFDDASAETKADENTCTDEGFPPCNPVKGTIGYRPDPADSSPHNKIGGVRAAQALGIHVTVGYEPAPHFNMSQMNQKPNNCNFFWKSLKVAVPPAPKPSWYGPLSKQFSR